MDANAYCGEFYSTDASTFNLSFFMVCVAQRFSHGTIMCKDGVGLHLQERRNMKNINGVELRKVRIYFYEDKIYYWFNKVMHCYTHAPTVKYIYYLMSLMGDVYWMKLVLNKVCTKKVKSLKHMCVMKCLHQEISDSSRRNNESIFYQ